MNLKGDRLYVRVGASEARRRLKGRGLGVRKVETAGKNLSVIIHTATGKHLRQLEALFYDALPPRSPSEEPLDGGIAPEDSLI